jgi:N5-(cytidine 5'-diphosphoramidyl)-L-glutamine hydrolase
MPIGITQRVLERPERSETWECLDQRLISLVQSIGHLPLPLSNAIENVPEYAEAMKLDGVILSGGNDLATVQGGSDISAQRDKFEAALINYCSGRGLPVFGICRGLQMLNCHFGGALASDRTHVAKPHIVAPLKAAPTDWPQSFTVNSFHGWTIPQAALAPQLTALAQAEDGTIEAAAHVSLPILGVMWHPERENSVSQRDLSLIRNLLGGVR